jgi:hypothetical protein
MDVEKIFVLIDEVLFATCRVHTGVGGVGRQG